MSARRYRTHPCTNCGRRGRTATPHAYQCATCRSGHRPDTSHLYADDDLALTGGYWARHGLTWKWHPHHEEGAA